MKKILLLIACLFLACGCNRKMEYQKIDLDQAKEKINKGAYLIDVRSKEEYKIGHIKGALNIPVEEIENPDKKIITKTDTIIVYCRSGSRSKQADLKLIEKGYKHVYDFGAMENWKQEDMMGRKSKKQKREENMIGSFLIALVVVMLLALGILIGKLIFKF